MKTKTIFYLMASLMLLSIVSAVVYNIDIPKDTDTYLQDKATTTGKTSNDYAVDVLVDHVEQEKIGELMRDYNKAYIKCRKNPDCMAAFIDLAGNY